MLDTFLATYTPFLAQAEESGAPTLNTVTGENQQGTNTTAPANGQTGQNGKTNPNQQKSPGLFGNPLLLMALVLVVVWVFMLRSTGKDKKRKAALLASMKKGSKVQTIGGILGTIVDIRDDTVIVKIDENNNTRMRFNRSAIQTVIEDKE